MTKSMKKDSAARSNESMMQMMDKVSNSLLIVTFILAAFLAFGGADLLATNLGISKWVPIGLLAVAVLVAIAELYFRFARTESAPREVVNVEPQ